MPLALFGSRKPKRSQGLVPLTDWELGHITRTNTCPDCGSGEFWIGPKGVVVDVECESCKAQFHLGVVGVFPGKGASLQSGERIKEPSGFALVA